MLTNINNLQRKRVYVEVDLPLSDGGDSPINISSDKRPKIDNKQYVTLLTRDNTPVQFEVYADADIFTSSDLLDEYFEEVSIHFHIFPVANLLLCRFQKTTTMRLMTSRFFMAIDRQNATCTSWNKHLRRKVSNRNWESSLPLTLLPLPIILLPLIPTTLRSERVWLTLCLTEFNFISIILINPWTIKTCSKSCNLKNSVIWSSLNRKCPILKRVHRKALPDSSAHQPFPRSRLFNG